MDAAMTHTPTPAEIETLRRKAKRHDLDCTRSPWASYCSCGADEALAILDRLSPPAPEVDEATVWTRKVLCVFMKSGEDPAPDAAEEYISGGFDEDADFIAARTALSELIASKDAEIERLSDELDELKNPIYCTICGSCGETGCGCTHKCLYPFSHPDVDAELAALRAENERLRTAVQFCRDQFDFYVDSHNKKGTEDGRRKAERNLGFVRLCDNALKAAERNTAEPDEKHETAFSISKRKYEEKIVDTAPVVEVTQAAEPPGHTDLMVSPESIDAFLGANPPVQTAPVVVTQADRASTLRARHYADNYTEVCRTFAYHRTEAEARGRREALEAATARLEWYRQYGAGMIDQRGFAASLIVELKRLMTEPKP